MNDRTMTNIFLRMIGLHQGSALSPYLLYYFWMNLLGISIMWFDGIWLFACDIIVIDWRVYYDIVLYWSEKH